MNILKNKAILAVIMIVLSILLIAISQSVNIPTSCSSAQKATPIVREGFYFDTYVSITVYDKQYEDIVSQCLDICSRYEKIFSRTSSDSELYQLNEALHNNYTLSYPISDTLYECIEDTLFYSRDFGIKYSILAGGLSNLWNHKEGKLPDDSTIAEYVDLLHLYTPRLMDKSFQLLSIDDATNDNLSDANTTIPIVDLGASAKGFIADKLYDHMISKGVTNGIIDLGGNIMVIGDKYDNSGYNIGIKKPFSSSNEIAAICHISNLALVTSGVYERYFTIDDKIYHHIIDCETGYPADNDILSVTIICPSATMADCYSTGCLLLGLNDALDLINSKNNIECVIIDKNYKVHISDGLEYKEDYICLK